MSIVALAIRLSAVKALLYKGGATIAGDRVYDSAISPMDALIGASPAPFIIVSTEDEVNKPTGADIDNGDRTVDFVIETALAKALSVTIPPDGNPGGEPIPQIVVSVPNTDAGLELSLAVLHRQIMACLWGRGGGPWGDIFRSLATGIETITSRRGMGSKDGARFAARQGIYSLRALAEPAYGQAPYPGTPLAAFVAALADEAKADPTFLPLAQVITAAIAGAPIGWPAVYTAAALAGGYTEAQGLAIGIVDIAPPAAPPGPGETERAVEIDVIDNDDGTLTALVPGAAVEAREGPDTAAGAGGQ